MTPYDIEMRNFDEVPRGILKEAKRQIKIMMQILDKNKYMPDYTYPLIDSYSIDTELCDLLIFYLKLKVYIKNIHKRI